MLGQLLQVTLKRLILQVSHLFGVIRAFLKERLIFLDLTLPGLSTHISHSQSAGLWACLFYLSPGWQCLNVSVVSSLSPQLGQPRTTPDQSPGVSWGLRPQSAIGDPVPVSLARPVLRVSSVSPLTGVTGPPASGHSLEAILHSTQCTVQTSWWCNFDVHSLLYHILYNFQRIMKNLRKPQASGNLGNSRISNGH